MPRSGESFMSEPPHEGRGLEENPKLFGYHMNERSMNYFDTVRFYNEAIEILTDHTRSNDSKLDYIVAQHGFITDVFMNDAREYLSREHDGDESLLNTTRAFVIGSITDHPTERAYLEKRWIADREPLELPENPSEQQVEILKRLREQQTAYEYQVFNELLPSNRRAVLDDLYFDTEQRLVKQLGGNWYIDSTSAKPKHIEEVIKEIAPHDFDFKPLEREMGRLAGE